MAKKAAGPTPHVPKRPEDIQYFRYRCLTDTGFVCRHLLGWDYDEDEAGIRTNIGSGGVRQDGAHGRMVAFIDDPLSHFKCMEAPRGSYKSTILQGFITRQILIDPNVRILYGMKTDKKVHDKALAIRNCLKMKEIEAVFGAQQGDEKWEIDSFTVSQRTQTNLQEPTFTTFSLETMPTGGHYNYIIVDDLIDRENCKTPEAIDNAKKVVGMLFPLLANGGYIIVVGTRYNDDDIYHELENKPMYAKLILGAGVRITRTQGQGIDLEVEEGGLTFPHLTLPKLKMALEAMTTNGNYYDFSCQYLNIVPTGMASPFTREMFKTLPWDQFGMRGFSGYLLTDTATSMRQEGCFSVVAYVLLDEKDNLYLADCRVGHWRPREFVDQFFDVLETWQKRVNHIGELWETISLVTVFKDMIDSDARTRRTRVNTVSIPRTSADHKFSRIDKLELPMLRGKFYVLSTVPRTFVDLNGPRTLFDSEGYKDSRTCVVLPGGELVDEFIRLRAHPKQDVADAIAMAMESDRVTGKRFCVYKKPFGRIMDGSVLTTGSYEVHPPATVLTQQRDDPSWWDETVRTVYGHQ